MQIPMPTPQLVAMALLASAFLVVSRFVVVFPILRALRQGHRASLLPAINLAQMSEFAMVIAAIGLSYQHIDRSTVSLLIFVFAFTSVASTYLIGYSHPLQEWLAGLLRKARLADLGHGQDTDAAAHALAGKDVVLLGFFTEASALVHGIAFDHVAIAAEVGVGVQDGARAATPAAVPLAWRRAPAAEFPRRRHRVVEADRAQ